MKLFLVLLFISSVSFAVEYEPKIWPIQFTLPKVTTIPESCTCNEQHKPVNCGAYIVCVKKVE